MVETTTGTAAPASGPRISKVVILLRQSRFDALKEALSSIGVTGLTVTQVLGCGVQKGQSEFYRGVPMDVTLLPKVKVEVGLCKGKKNYDKRDATAKRDAAR